MGRSETALGTGTLSAIACPSTTHCYVVGVTFAGGHAVIMATSDAGATWTAQSAPGGTGSLSNIACPSTTTCYAGGSGIIGTTNSGKTWSSQTLPREPTR